MHFKTTPALMGIVNVTPDSFSDGGLYATADAALGHIESLTKAGADILDIGAVSTRPGASPVSVVEECRRLLPVLRRYKGATDLPFSIDTTKSEVAALAIAHGASLVNDVSAGLSDPGMLACVAKAGVSYAVMHMQGTPATMQVAPMYSNVVDDVYVFLSERVKAAREAGILDVIVDPGIGFGKTVAHNLALLRHMRVFTTLGPVLLGTSRKSFIGHVHADISVSRDEGTLVSMVFGMQAGVSLLRVHDVAAAYRMRDMYWAIVEAQP